VRRRPSRGWSTTLVEVFLIGTGVLLLGVFGVDLISPPWDNGSDNNTSAAASSSSAPPAKSSPKPNASPTPDPTKALTVSSPLAGSTFTGTPAVGVLFSTSNGGNATDHYCSASVVDSPTKDVIVTAAHCVTGASQSLDPDLAFAPGYHDGKTPYGVWTATQVIVDSKWASSSSNVDDDVAFIVVGKPGSSQKIEDTTGAEKLGAGRPSNQVVRVIGYPDTSAEPISCQNTTSAFNSHQMEFDCGNYASGTSGGPFLTDIDANTDTGTVVGVIGGYQQGGNVPEVSYSVIFSDETRTLYNAAVAKG
jgi:V8-like Glu-specific endopeptidase